MKEQDQQLMEKESERYGIIANNLSLSAGSKELIAGANFVIDPGRKVALIGRNGSGKTTLLDTIYSIADSSDLPK